MCTPRNLVLLTFSPAALSGKWWVFGVASPEVNNNLFCFADIQQEVVVSAPRGQMVAHFPVVGLVVPGDETHQSCVVCKLHHVIGAVGLCTVVSQQGEEQGTEHIALGGLLCNEAVEVVGQRAVAVADLWRGFAVHDGLNALPQAQCVSAVFEMAGYLVCVLLFCIPVF